MKSQIHATAVPSKVNEDPAEEAAESKEYEQHEIENAADHVVKAEEIKQKPKLLNHVMVHLAGKQAAINSGIKSVKKIKSLDDLKKHAYNMIKGEDKSAKEA